MTAQTAFKGFAFKSAMLFKKRYIDHTGGVGTQNKYRGDSAATAFRQLAVGSLCLVWTFSHKNWPDMFQALLSLVKRNYHKYTKSVCVCVCGCVFACLFSFCFLVTGFTAMAVYFFSVLLVLLLVCAFGFLSL